MGTFVRLSTSALIAVITSSFGCGWIDNTRKWNPPGIFLNILLVIWVVVFTLWIEKLMKRGQMK